MSCSPEILLFVKECEAKETEERRAKFITEEVEAYRRKATTPKSQDTSMIGEEWGEVVEHSNGELLNYPLDEEIRDSTNTGEISEGIVKWKGEYIGRASGDTYSETEVLDAQKKGNVLWTMYVDQGQCGGYKKEVWFNQETDEAGWTTRDDNGESYLCAPGWLEPKDSLDPANNPRDREEPYPKEVYDKALEIMSKATWLPNVSQPTPRSGKYFLKGDSGDSGFISWTEGGKVCYVSSLDGNILEICGGKTGQYKGFGRGRGAPASRLLLGTALLDYFAPWR